MVAPFVTDDGALDLLRAPRRTVIPGRVAARIISRADVFNWNMNSGPIVPDGRRALTAQRHVIFILFRRDQPG